MNGVNPNAPVEGQAFELLPQHAKLIDGSGISIAVARARGYRSISRPEDLRALGFAGYQRLVPGLLVPIHDVHGNVALHQHRPDVPRNGANGRIVKYETPEGSRLVVDVPPSVRQALTDPLVPLVITEGVRKADAAVSCGICCVDVLGVWSWRRKNADGEATALPDFDRIALNGRRVVIAFDSDVTTKPQVRTALERLRAFLARRGALVQVTLLPAGPDGGKVGLDDYLAAGHAFADLAALPDPFVATRDARTSRSESDRGVAKIAMAEQLLEIATADTLFQDDRGEAYAVVELRNVQRLLRVAGDEYKRTLAGRCFEKSRKAPSGDALQSAVRVLQSRVLPDGPRHVLHNRFARDGDAIWVDMADDRNRAVRVDAGGWRVVDRPPILFRRFAHQRALPDPVAGGDVDALRGLLHLDADDTWELVRAFIVTAMIPGIPHPILLVHGSQGSSKTTAARMIRRLIDPSAVETLELDDKPAELAQHLDHHAVAPFDNLSRLTRRVGDILCKASTGGVFSKRQLYTDGDDCLFHLQTVVILTAIVPPTQQPDLLDRMLAIELTRIAPEARREEGVLWAEFEAMRPQLFGSILDLLSAAMRILPAVHLASLPRMADFARWGAAVARAATGDERAFLTALDANTARHEEHLLEGEPLLQGIVALMNEVGEFRGTISQLMDRLEADREAPQGRLGWPRSPGSFSRRVRELKVSLAGLGVEFEFLRGRRNGRHLIMRSTPSFASSRA